MRRGLQIAVFLMLSGAAMTQRPADAPVFDVVSVKPIRNPGNMGCASRPRPGDFQAQYCSLDGLVQLAYGLPAYRVFGAKGWEKSDNFSVTGTYTPSKGERPFTAGATRMRAVLDRRFHLTLHWETRSLPVFFLRTRRGGSRLRPETNASLPDRWRELDDRGGAAGMVMQNGEIVSLGSWLSRLLGLEVVNQTNLQEHYSFTLQFTSRALMDQPGASGAVSVFSALSNQLGLELKAGRAAEKVLVINGASRPTPN